jgi:hypothetical protein
MLAAEPLASVQTATTVRNGKVLITHGPFAKTKEQLVIQGNYTPTGVFP